jgi:hypothetical protein
MEFDFSIIIPHHGTHFKINSASFGNPEFASLPAIDDNILSNLKTRYKNRFLETLL